MPIKFMKRYTRELIQAHPDWLFVFGDNFARAGYGGQAKEARGEPNAVGIPTKRRPQRDESAYLTDIDFEEWQLKTKQDWARISVWLERSDTVVWPMDGIGTGLAELSERAPLIASEIEWRFQALLSKHG